MSSSLNLNHVSIVGAGLGGTLMSIYLAQAGVGVTIYERQKFEKDRDYSNRRSFNVTISERGLKALERVGILERVLQKTIPVRGRMCHTLDGCTQFYPYGIEGKDELYAIRRQDMNEVLVECAMEHPNVRFELGQQCTHVDKQSGQLTLCDVDNPSNTQTVESDFVIGADGAFSTVRDQMQRGERADFRKDFLDWGYREIIFPAGPDGSYQMDPNAIHIWPRGNFMLFALPNPDGSFTGSFNCPFNADLDFSDPETVQTFFEAQFPDVVEMLPNIGHEISRIPVSHFVTVRTSKWYHNDKIVLLGDAAHGIIPFYGQGMNSAFEDCYTLLDCLADHPEDRTTAFAAYQHERKRHADAIADLSIENFVELRDNVRSPFLQARKEIDLALYKRFPNHWQPLHILISHTSMKHADALDKCRRRERLIRWLGMDVLVLGLAITKMPRLIEESVRSFSLKDLRKKRMQKGDVVSNPAMSSSMLRAE